MQVHFFPQVGQQGFSAIQYPAQKMKYSEVRERHDFFQYKVSVLHRCKVYYKASRDE